MAKTLLEQLPEIVAKGRKQAEQILESLEGKHRVSLQTREWVLPAKDSAIDDWIYNQQRQQHTGQQDWVNRLIYGDNLLAMAALLAGDEHTPSLRGKIDLIYIDPPFDSKADYRTKVVLPDVEVEQRPTVFEQFAYSDMWHNGTASYLEMITPRLILMRELLSDTGSIYVHLDWHVGHYVKLSWMRFLERIILEMRLYGVMISGSLLQKISKKITIQSLDIVSLQNLLLMCFVK